MLLIKKWKSFYIRKMSVGQNENCLIYMEVFGQNIQEGYEKEEERERKGWNRETERGLVAVVVSTREITTHLQILN